MNAQTARSSRSVERQVTGRETSDGAGVQLTRVLTQDLQHRLDPFLMLDAFASDDPNDYLAAFPTICIAASRPSPTCVPAAVSSSLSQRG